jgi:hypothetical protein
MSTPRFCSSSAIAALTLSAGADRHRALVDHHLVVGHQAADVAGGGEHVLQVGRAVFIRRRADGNELDGAVLHGLPTRRW